MKTPQVRIAADILLTINIIKFGSIKTNHSKGVS